MAILRTLGRAARLNPVDNRAEFWDGKDFSSPETAENSEETSVLALIVESSMKPQQDYGLSYWKGEWENLELKGEKNEALRLKKGIYWLHTVKRLPSGMQLISHKLFELSSDMSLNVEKRKAEKSQLLSDFKVKLPVENCGLELQIYLEPGAEPTEHSLNELIENSEKIKVLREKGLSLRLILPDERGRENPTYKKTVTTLEKAREQILDFKDPGLEALARAVYLEPGLFPLISLSDGETSYFAHAGYSVGTISLALSLGELLLK